MTGLNKEIILRGVDMEAISRIMFRLSFILSQCKERRDVLANGNLASLEPELMFVNSNLEDLTHTMLEFFVLMGSSISQKEQGLISPPSEEAPSSDAPMG
jgi:hypothetical protein